VRLAGIEIDPQQHRRHRRKFERMRYELAG
jgi:hypothetical protein